MRIQKKICLLGSDGVGKTSVVVRFTKGTFSNSYLVTLGVDFYEYTFIKKNEKEKRELIVQIWDLASQRSFQTMRSQYLSYSNFVIIVVDYNRITPDFIKPWIADIKKHAGKDVPFLIALNKIDLLNSEEESKVVKELESEYNVKVFATSAKTGENIVEMFQYIADSLW
ncbi:Rab family GTPase [Candidatus Harpocratesius sp.]